MVLVFRQLSPTSRRKENLDGWSSLRQHQQLYGTKPTLLNFFCINILACSLHLTILMYSLGEISAPTELSPLTQEVRKTRR